jgi:hypothetical protein
MFVSSHIIFCCCIRCDNIEILFSHVRIMHAVENHDDYFVQKRNAAHKLILSCLQKVTAAFHMLCNGVAVDTTDAYVCIGESTVIESMRRFVISVVELF